MYFIINLVTMPFFPFIKDALCIQIQVLCAYVCWRHFCYSKPLRVTSWRDWYIRARLTWLLIRLVYQGLKVSLKCIKKKKTFSDVLEKFPIQRCNFIRKGVYNRQKPTSGGLQGKHPAGVCVAWCNVLCNVS